MPGEWRSAAAQTFVQGRITKVDGYWRSTALSAEIIYMIDEWDLWTAAFGGGAEEVKKAWRKYRSGPGIMDGLTTKAGRLFKAAASPPLGQVVFDALEQEVLGPMQGLINSRPLTINFKARDWFGTQAGFDEYITMWDRKRDDASLNVNPDPQNPAHVRAKADRWALYGQFDDGKTEAVGSGLKLPHVKYRPGTTAPPSWGYSPAKASGDSQVFAALNYGGRPHGASTRYGRSHFLLHDGYKTDAIYFAMDTFTPLSLGMNAVKDKSQRSRLYQVSAQSFGGGILLATKSQYEGNRTDQNKRNSVELVTNLLTAARRRTPLPDTDQEHLLIEAHIFRRVPMRPDSVSAVSISSTEFGGSVRTGQANARAFSARTGVPVHFTD